MKRYDAWSEPDPQCGFGGGRCELYERTLGQYVTFDDHEREVSALRAELARVKAESLRVVKGVPLRLGDIESVPISEHTNTFTTAGADWRIYAAERRVDESGHRYMMPVSDEWPPIAFGPDTIVQPVRLGRWEDE